MISQKTTPSLFLPKKEKASDFFAQPEKNGRYHLIGI